MGAWRTSRAHEAVLSRAVDVARRNADDHCGVAHLLSALAEAPASTPARRVLTREDRPTDDRPPNESGTPGGMVAVTPQLQQVLAMAAGMALQAGAEAVTDEMVLLAVCFHAPENAGAPRPHSGRGRNRARCRRRRCSVRRTAGTGATGQLGSRGLRGRGGLARRGSHDRGAPGPAARAGGLQRLKLEAWAPVPPRGGRKRSRKPGSRRGVRAGPRQRCRLPGSSRPRERQLVAAAPRCFFRAVKSRDT